MIFKINSIVLLGIIATTVSARSEYKYETSSGQIANTTSSRNDALLQQLAAGSLRRSESLNNMPLDTESKTEVPLKNVRNISDNKLPNDYTSIDHEATQHMGMWQEVEEDDKNTPSSEEHARIRLNSREEEYGTEIPLSKKNRTSRVFSVVTTTSRTIPQYIRRKEEEKPILTQEDFNVSDYAEDEKIDRIQKHTTNIPFYMNMNNSSEENDEMLPLAMKYYDEISPEHASSTRRIEAVSSEDYYEDEYHEPELSTKTAANVHTPNNNILDFSTFVTTTISTTRTTATTPTQNPLPITFPANIPIIGQFDESLLTTFAPQTALSQLQTTTPGTSSPGAATIADKRGKQIPILSTVPIVTTTTTTTSRRRLLPHEQLRNYIEDAYIRMPLAVIVDPSVESLEKTKSLWNDGLRTNLNIKIVLVTLNESHESPAAFNFNNTRQFLTGLNSIKEHYSGDAFRGISHAAELVPYDSAVYISTAQLAKHTDQVQDSMITLLKKRIKLYLIWFGERSLSENETQDSVGGILGEMAIRSGGEILHLVSSENSQELEDSTLTIVADALRGSQEIDVPVDTTLSSLHVQIDQMMRKAVLETPNGEINLKKLVKFKIHSLTTFEDEDKRLDAYVPLTKLRKATVYKLIVTPEDLTSEYSVFIRGERKPETFMDNMIKHFETYFYDGHTSYPVRVRSAKLEQSITNDTADDYVHTNSKLQLPTHEDKFFPKNEVETFSTEEIHQNTIHMNKNNISFPTVHTAQRKNSDILFRTNTKIEMGIQSQILIAPGIIGQLYFEVTNTGNEARYYYIQVVDERRYLVGLTPQWKFLQPGQMTIVRVSVFVPQNAQANTIDHITFSTTTNGGDTASLSVNLKVTTSIDLQDNTPPYISWVFGTRCEDVSSRSDSCSERFWTMYITAQDLQTGIMRLQATPSSGLVYTKPYTVGTTEPLSATYVASCCEPKISLTAFDAAGNQRSHPIDVNDLVLTDASIAAIVLGVILLILLIILSIAAIIWCCRRRKIVLDLPTYRSHSTRSME